MKKLREMAPKSSIPRIIEISNFNSKHEKKKEKNRETTKATVVRPVGRGIKHRLCNLYGFAQTYCPYAPIV